MRYCSADSCGITEIISVAAETHSKINRIAGVYLDGERKTQRHIVAVDCPGEYLGGPVQDRDIGTGRVGKIIAFEPPLDRTCPCRRSSPPNNTILAKRSRVKVDSPAWDKKRRMVIVRYRIRRYYAPEKH